MFLFLHEPSHDLLFGPFSTVTQVTASLHGSCTLQDSYLIKQWAGSRAPCVYPEGLAKSSEMIDVWVDGLVWWVRTATPTPSLTDDHRDPAEGGSGLGEEIIHRKKSFSISRPSRDVAYQTLPDVTIPAKGEFSKWHPGWGREYRKAFFTV